MSSWRDRLLRYLKEDWQNYKLDSHLCEHFRERGDQMPRVRLKRAYALHVSGETNTDVMLLACLRVIQEQNLLDLAGLARIVEARRNGESEKAYNRRARERLKAVIDGTQPLPALDDGFARKLAEEALHRLPSTSDQVALSMECRWDAEAGTDALCTLTERDELLAKVRKKSSKAKQFPVKWEGEPTGEFIEHEVVPNAIMQRAYTFLDNAGVAFGDAATERFVSHTSEIPVGLVQRCITSDVSLAAELGIVTHRAQGGTRARSLALSDGERAARIADLERLYHALNDGDHRSVVVPVEIDPETGMGLYVIGSDFVTGVDPEDKETRSALALAFERYSRFGRDASAIFSAGFDKPFFAIMYRYEDRSFVFDAHTQRYGSPKVGALVRNLWDSVVDAWIPDTKAGRTSFGKFAYLVFERSAEFALGLDAYWSGNFQAPAGCPERFRKYFE